MAFSANNLANQKKRIWFQNKVTENSSSNAFFFITYCGTPLVFTKKPWAILPPTGETDTKHIEIGRSDLLTPPTCSHLRSFLRRPELSLISIAGQVHIKGGDTVRILLILLRTEKTHFLHFYQEQPLIQICKDSNPVRTPTRCGL